MSGSQVQILVTAIMKPLLILSPERFERSFLLQALIPNATKATLDALLSSYVYDNSDVICDVEHPNSMKYLTTDILKALKGRVGFSADRLTLDKSLKKMFQLYDYLDEKPWNRARRLTKFFMKRANIEEKALVHLIAMHKNVFEAVYVNLQKLSSFEPGRITLSTVEEICVPASDNIWLLARRFVWEQIIPQMSIMKLFFDCDATRIYRWLPTSSSFREGVSNKR